MIQIETIFDIVLKGILIGVIASAPLAPVGVLCLQRTLPTGRWSGFATGVGACVRDIPYALITGSRMRFLFASLGPLTVLFFPFLPFTLSLSVKLLYTDSYDK